MTAISDERAGSAIAVQAGDGFKGKAGCFPPRSSGSSAAPVAPEDGKEEGKREPAGAVEGGRP